MVALLITKLEITWKFGEPNPVTASHPGTALNEYGQQGAESMDDPTPQACDERKYTLDNLTHIICYSTYVVSSDNIIKCLRVLSIDVV